MTAFDPKGEISLEQPKQVKCHLCGAIAEESFAYARFSARDAFLGVIYRGVCRDCLLDYIENIKKDRKRGELLVWPMVLLPVGALLAALSSYPVSQIIGYCLIGLAVVLPISMRIWQRREARFAARASEAENIRRYSEQMCREDAQRTSRQTKLIYLKTDYASEGAEKQIAKETGMKGESAVLLARLARATLAGHNATVYLQ